MDVTDGNPYARFVALARGVSADSMPAGDSEQAGTGAAPARMRLGEVISKEPLKVKVAGLNQPTEALKINERLVKGAKWKTKTTSPNSDIRDFTGPISGPVQGVHGIGSLIEFTGGDVHIPDTTIDEATVSKLDTYLADAAFEEFTVYANWVGALLISIDGVVDYDGLTLNGNEDNLVLGEDGVPVRGRVDLT